MKESFNQKGSDKKKKNPKKSIEFSYGKISKKLRRCKEKSVVVVVVT
jgi:hypothetical protein